MVHPDESIFDVAVVGDRSRRAFFDADQQRRTNECRVIERRGQVA